jgi:hypothetical protein
MPASLPEWIALGLFLAGTVAFLAWALWLAWRK